MTLLQMEYFVTVVDAGSFTQAANTLFVSRQALKDSLRKLGLDLGCELIKSSNTGVVVTPLGQAFYARAVSILSQVKDLENDIHSMSHQMGPVKLSISECAIPYGSSRLLKLIYKFSEQYTGLIKAVTRFDNSGTLPCLEEGYDAAFVFGDIRQSDFPNYEFELYRSDDIGIYLYADHPCVQKQALELADLDGLPLCVPGPPETYLHGLYEACKKAGISPDYRIAANIPQLRMMQENHSVAFTNFSRSYVNMIYPERRITGCDAKVGLYFVRRKDEYNPTLDKLHDYLFLKPSAPV